MFAYVYTKQENRIAEKLMSLTNIDTFWDDVRKFTKNVHSERTIRLWEWLSEIRYDELLTGTENVRTDYIPQKLPDGRIKFTKHYYTWEWEEIFPIIEED